MSLLGSRKFEIGYTSFCVTAWVGWIVLFVWFCMTFSCAPAYPQCQPADATKFRCNGAVVEMCDGSTWNPRIDCKEQWNEDGELVPQECVESGNDAECE